MKSIEVRYFALFREKAKKEIEELTVDLTTYLELYEHLSRLYGFGLPAEMVQVAVNDEFSSLHLSLEEGARVVFIPPVAGG
jgi:molybdopterin synthase sulfur carrier subunit